MKDEVVFLGTIEDEKYGKIAHFFSNDKGNYFCKIVEKKMSLYMMNYLYLFKKIY